MSQYTLTFTFVRTNGSKVVRSVKGSFDQQVEALQKAATWVKEGRGKVTVYGPGVVRTTERLQEVVERLRVLESRKLVVDEVQEETEAEIREAFIADSFMGRRHPDEYYSAPETAKIANLRGKQCLQYRRWNLKYYPSDRTYFFVSYDGKYKAVYWNKADGVVGLLHEYGHAISDSHDEVIAWKTAVAEFGLDEFLPHREFIRECLATYGLEHAIDEILTA